MSNYLRTIKTLTARLHLTTKDAADVMEELMTGQLTEIQTASLLSALTTKGETVEELLGFAQVMRKHAIAINCEGPLLDTCGTGGSGLDTPNTSTLSAFVLAARGVKVAKHGNRSSSGKCGSADVLEKLGVKIDLNPSQVETLINEQNFGFMMAPTFHPAMRYAGPVRKAMGFRTTFNFLGPLVNPANVQRQILGVSDVKRAPLMAQTLCEMGIEHAIVVHGSDGLDEITLTGSTHYWNITDGELDYGLINPEELGCTLVKPEEIQGGDAATNVKLFEEVLGGKNTGPISELVALNAAAGLWVSGLSSSLEDGFSQARQVLKSGRALAKFESYRKRTQELAT